MSVKFRKLAVMTLTSVSLLPMVISPATATGTQNPAVQYNPDGTVRCVKNGWGFQDPSGYAPANSCFHSEPKVGVDNLPEPLAEMNPNLTEEDLIKVENTSVLSPETYIGKDTYAAKPLTGNEPISPLSREMTANFQQSNYAFNHWSTGENAGQIGSVRYAAHENIPIYTVDSSNPHQNYIWVESKDGRAIHVPGYGKIMAGKIPFPEWALKDRGLSGDKSVAIYDKATGIWRSMFFFGGIGEDGKFVNTTTNPDTPLKHTEDGLPIYTYASGGYILGKPNFEGLGKDNYWTTLQGGTSSVAGMSNELTQIGVDEIRAGEINHAISMTAADYHTAPASFPAKQSDGRINMIVSEGSSQLDGSEFSKRFRVSKFQSGKVDPALNDKYRNSLQVLINQGLVKVNSDFSIISSELTVDTDTAEFSRKYGVNQTHVNNVKEYLLAGDMLTVTEAPLPYTPKAGQRFTIPADVDVEALADAHGLSEFDRMRLRAIQKYGGILTDRNAFIHAFNLEAAASYAPYAREGKNVYVEDPEIAAKLKGSNSHAFPWQAVVWLDENYVGTLEDNSVKQDTSLKMTSPEGEKETIYLQGDVNDQVYASQEIYLDPTNHSVLPSNVTFHAPWFTAKYDVAEVSNHHDMSWHFKAPATAQDSRKVLELNTVGFVKVDSTLGRLNGYIDYTKFSIDNPTEGKKDHQQVIQSKELSDKYRVSWNVETIDRNSPIARTDTVKLKQGEATVVNPMANDEAYYGAKAHKRTSQQEDNSWGELFLVDPSGNNVKTLSKDGVTYTVTADNKVEVKATSADPGYAEQVKYRVLRYSSESLAAGASPVASEAWSKPGSLQALVYTGQAIIEEETVPPTAEPSPETPESPLPEPSQSPEPIEPEPSTEPEPEVTAEPEKTPEPVPTTDPEPTTEPEPTAAPTVEPEPTTAPTAEPSQEPTVEPTGPVAPVSPIETPLPEVPVNPSPSEDTVIEVPKNEDKTGEPVPTQEPSKEPTVNPSEEPKVNPDEETKVAPSPEATVETSPESVDNPSENTDPSIQPSQESSEGTDNSSTGEAPVAGEKTTVQNQGANTGADALVGAGLLGILSGALGLGALSLKRRNKK